MAGSEGSPVPQALRLIERVRKTAMRTILVIDKRRSVNLPESKTAHDVQAAKVDIVYGERRLVLDLPFSILLPIALLLLLIALSTASVDAVPTPSRDLVIA